MKTVKVLFFVFAALLVVTVIPVAASFGATFIGAIISGFFGLLIVSFLLSIPMGFVVLCLPVTHPWNIKLKKFFRNH